MTYSYLKQFPVLPPGSYAEGEVAFNVPRVLELTYTPPDLNDWAQYLGYDGLRFPCDPECRALLRAELDAYYARLYSLSREDLCYILDPQSVIGAACGPSPFAFSTKTRTGSSASTVPSDSCSRLGMHWSAVPCIKENLCSPD